MRPSQVSYGATTDLLLRVSGEIRGIRAGAECEVGTTWLAGRGIVAVAGKPLSARAADAAASLELDTLTARGLPRISWIASVHKEADEIELGVRVHEFRASLAWRADTVLAVDERNVADVLGRYLQPDTPMERVLEWLAAECLLPHPDHPEVTRGFVSYGGGGPGNGPVAFRLCGVNVAVDVRAGPDRNLRVTRVGPLRPGGVDYRAVDLIESQFRFVDATAASEAQSAALGQLTAIVERESSFLGLWEQYNRADQRYAARRRDLAGEVKYRSIEHLGGRAWRFHLADSQFEAASRLADALDPGGGDLVEAAAKRSGQSLGESAASPTGTAGGRPPPIPHSFVGRLVAVRPDAEWISVRADETSEARPPAEGVLLLSSRGDETRIKRRDEALAIIRSSRGAMPQLGLIIQGRRAPTATYRRVQAWSPAALQALGGPPTPQQTRAMEVALNTPDIALIQGPPGTGKTRLIAALQVRLNELEGDATDAAAPLLLTSFQHDAVEHAASATTVNGLPAVKVGRRQGRRALEDSVEIWRRQQVAALRGQDASGSSISARRVLRALQGLEDAYAAAPGSLGQAAAVLRKAVQLTQHIVPADLTLRMAAHVQSLEARFTRSRTLAADDGAFLWSCAAALRWSLVGLADDGVLTARRLISQPRIEERLGEALMGRVQACASGAPSDPVELRDLRDQVLDRLMTSHEAPMGYADAETEELLAAALAKVQDHARAGRATVPDVLDEYAAALESDIEAVRASLARHAAVLAATCQQSGGKAMQNLLVDTRGAEGRHGFDSVIVDEAARANPLDLMIPLSRARRRVVLVGDHRQLPHMLEPEVEREMDAAADGQAAPDLRQSMFELLFTQHLPSQVSADGIARVVTLDTQFRMHPVLGDFVSRAFYERTGDVRLRHGRAASVFEHALWPFQGRVAVWLDVPADNPDNHERGGLSKSRPIEAAIIARELRALLAQPAAEGLTFGVVAFYRAQVEAVWQAAVQENLAVRGSAGAFKVAAAVGHTRSGYPRLSIGTVDAFQGKEFDVVILSMTRSNRMGDETEAQARRRYGHLTLTNRLCVSMSRQRRLLIVAGDSSLLESPNAGKWVPALSDFRALCETPHGMVQRAQ